MRAQNLAFALAATGSIASAQQPAQLTSVTSQATTQFASSALHAADFDGDGIEDVMIAHSTAPHGLVLMKGQPGRKFQPIAAGSAPDVLALESGRINSDPLRDLVLLASTGVVSVRLGLGLGAFAPPVLVATLAGATSMATGDLDNDGKLDLAVTSSAGVSVFAGNALGGFALGATTPSGINPSFVRIANLNGDALRDVVVANLGASSATVLFNSPGGLGAALTHPFPAPLVSFDVGDMNADAAVDLVAASANSIAFAFGNGLGGFAPALHVPLPNGVARIDVGDVTGDGLLDVVAARGNAGRIEVLENRGSPNFALGASVPVATGSAALDLGEFDGDGLLDLVHVTGNTYQRAWFAWGPLQAIHKHQRLVTPAFYPNQLRANDIDGDGDTDLVSNGGSSGIAVRTQGVGGFSAPLVIPGAHDVNALEIADVDGDGRLDVVAADDFAGYADVFRGQPNGTLALSSSQRMGPSPVAMAIADFNADGVLDCAAANRYHHNVSVRLGLGGGLFANFVSFGSMLAPHDIEAADIDSDGDLDLAVSTFGSSSPGLVFLRNDGAANFTQVGVLSALNSHQVRCRDIDFDGDVDFALCSVTTGSAVLLFNNGAGAFTALPLPSPGSYPSTIDIGDLDGDGDLDLAVGHALDSQVCLFEQYAPQQWRYAGSEPVGASPADIVLAHLDSDGSIDIGTANFYGYDLTLLTGAHAPYGNVENYCTATSNSLGCTPIVSVSGLPSASSPQSCTVLAESQLNQAPGIFYYGLAPAAVPFSGGWRCVALPLRRTAVQNSGGSTSGSDCTGSYSFDWNAHVRSGVDPALTPGVEAFAQFWSRDGAAPSGANLTSAVSLVIAP